MNDKKKRLNLGVALLAATLLAALIFGIGYRTELDAMEISDGIERIDLDTIYLQSSGVEVNFSQVLLSDQEESRKLIVSTCTGTVSTELTDRLIRQLDFDFLKKTQNVSYAGTGYFVVDLDRLTAADIVTDKGKKTVTISIGHPYLQAIEIDPENIIIDEVQEGLLARGDIKLTVADYKAIEQELRTRLEETFDTAANGQAADDLALKMVREVYEPIVQAIDPRYTVEVVFQ